MVRYFKFFLFVIIINAGHSGIAQKSDTCKYHIEGTIYNLETGEPLPFAAIQIKGTTKGTVANEDGYFYLNTICEEEFDLIFSFVGFKPVVHHHDIHHKLPKIYLAPEDITLQSVIIEGESLAGDLNSATVKKITTKQLEARHGESLGEIAGSISGVSVIKTGQNVVKPVIHGLHSNRILVINNGVRHEYQSWGQDHAPEIDPSQAENIQVIKGAATVRYGPDAIGGVILVNPPKLDLLTDFAGDVEVTGKSNGRALIGNARIQKGYHKIAFAAEGSYLVQGDLETPDYYLTNTAKKENSVSLNSRYHIKKWDFEAFFSHFYQKLGILRGSVTGSLNDLVNAMENEPPPLTGPFDYEIENPNQEVSHDLFKINGSYNQEHSIWNFQYAFQANSRKEFDIRRGTLNERPSIDLMLYSHTMDIDWKHPEYKDWLGTIGIQALYQDNNNQPGTNTVIFIPNYNNYRIGAFIIESKQLSDLLIEWGVRYDYLYSYVKGRKQNNDLYTNHLAYHNFSATAGIEKKLANGNSFRSNIGSAWRPPSVSELYSFGKHQSVLEYGLLRYDYDENEEIVVGDILSDEQKTVDSEVGFKWINSYTITNKKIDAEFTGYVNYINNYLYTQPVGITQTIRGAFPYFIHRQTDALVAGFDLSLLYNHSKKINSRVQGSYLWSRDVKNNDYFVGQPPTQLNYELNINTGNFLFFKKSSVSLNIEYSFKPFYTPQIVPINEILEAKTEGRELFTVNSKTYDILPAPDGYVLAGFSWRSEYKQWSYIIKVSNVFDQEYRTYTDRLRYFSDEIGRNFIISLKYNF